MTNQTCSKGGSTTGLLEVSSDASFLLLLCPYGSYMAAWHPCALLAFSVNGISFPFWRKSRGLIPPTVLVGHAYQNPVVGVVWNPRNTAAFGEGLP